MKTNTGKSGCTFKNVFQPNGEVTKFGKIVLSISTKNIKGVSTTKESLIEEMGAFNDRYFQNLLSDLIQSGYINVSSKGKLRVTTKGMNKIVSVIHDRRVK